MRTRIRTIKPSAFVNEDLWDLEVETGLPVFRGFVGLWTVADREGRFEWRPRPIKAAVLPYWEGDFSRVLDALATRGFIRKYTVAGRDYGLVTGFTKHQAINNKEPASELPGPHSADAETRETTQESTREPRVDDACGTRTPAGLGVPEGNGNGNGNGNGVNPPTPPAGGEGGGGKPKRSEATAAEREVFEHWRSTFRKSAKAKLDPKRKRRIAWALDAYGIEAVKRAIDGYAADPWTRGQNDRGRAYDDLSLLLRDAEHVERGLEFADGKGPRLSGRLPVSTGWGDADTKASQAEFDEMFPPLEAAHG